LICFVSAYLMCGSSSKNCKVPSDLNPCVTARAWEHARGCAILLLQLGSVARGAGRGKPRYPAKACPGHTSILFILLKVHNFMRPNKGRAALQLGGEARGADAAVDAAAAPQELRFADSRGLVARHAWLPGGRLLVGFSTGGRPSTMQRNVVACSARSWTPAPRPLRRHQAYMRITTCQAPLQEGLLAMTPCCPSAWLCRMSNEPMRQMRGGLPQPPLQGLLYSQREAGELAPVCRERGAARRRRPCPRP